MVVSLYATLPETNSSHLKMHGWNTIVSFWDGLFSEAFAVSFREGTVLLFIMRNMRNLFHLTLQSYDLILAWNKHSSTVPRSCHVSICSVNPRLINLSPPTQIARRSRRF